MLWAAALPTAIRQEWTLSKNAMREETSLGSACSPQEGLKKTYKPCKHTTFATSEVCKSLPLTLHNGTHTNGAHLSSEPAQGK